MSATAQPSRPFPAPGRAPAGASVVAVGRGTLIGAGLAVSLLALWASGTTWYLLCRDEIAARLVARQAEMQYAYEDKVGALRAHLDRIASQKILEQDGLEGRLADLVARQVQLETRQTMLSTLAERAGAPAPAGVTRSPEPPPAETPASAFAPTPKPTPIPEAFDLRLRHTSPPDPAPARLQRTSQRDLLKGPLPERLARLDGALSQVETTQLRTLDGVVRAAQAKLLHIRTAVTQTGLDPDRLQAAPAPMGGPLVPLDSGAKPGPFDRLAEHAAASLLQLDRLRRAAAALPFGRPIPGEPDLTSGFGTRADPFTRAPALHTGLDFRADHGAPVRATGAGRVVGADYAGGYGNMVEIDHGNGVTTRYAHLSVIGVSVGQTVAEGAILGRVGSTGRSTGAHLHYETRLNDDPVDPQRFLRAGARLAALTDPAR